MIEKRYRDQIFLSDIPKDNAMMESFQISSTKSDAIDQVLQRSDHILEEKVQPYWIPIPRAVGEVSSVLASVSPMLNNENLYDSIRKKTDPGKLKLLIRSTNVSYKEFLVKNDNKTAVMTNSDSDSEEGGDQFLDNLFKSASNGGIDMDATMVSAVHGGK